MRKYKRFIFLVTLFLGLRGLYGLPEGSEATSGGGTFSTQGGTMTFTAPDGSVFRHTSFNVASGEMVKFVQPGVNARVLNRIDASSSSTINGRVEANGKLYFAAPGGLIFGEGSVIQARHLQAVGGDIFDTDFQNGRDRYPILPGSVENRGTIEADTIILGGKTVTNSGNLKAGGGTILLATGGGMEISNASGSLAVDISEGISAGSSMAGDMAGHALLQSGVLEASSVQLSGSKITHTGTIEASTVTVSGFTDFDGANGKTVSSHVHLNPKENRFSDAVLNGKNNQVARLVLDGSYNQLKVRSERGYEVVNTSSSGSVNVAAQQVDLRTANGDLSLGVTFSPVFSGNISSSSLVLASKTGQVTYPSTGMVPSYEQVVVYGNNVMQELADAYENTEDNLFILNATLLDFESLTPGLDAATIFKLEDENPSLNLSGSNQITTPEMIAQEDPGFDPRGENLAGTGVPVSGGAGGQAVAGPETTPNVSDIVGNQVGGEKLTENQLNTAMDLGLYSKNKYLLQSMPQDEVDLLLLAKVSGQASLFGGSYDTVGDSSKTDSGPTESEQDSSGSEATEFEDESDGEDSSDDSAAEPKQAGEETPAEVTARAMNARMIVGSRPLSPITRPVFSPQAKTMLEKGLAPQIEETLKGFSNR
jgi:filamentous hemagglutinin family protein